MSWWTDIRDPVIGTAIAGPMGTTAGFGYDAATGNGLFAPGDPRNQYYFPQPDYPGFNSLLDKNNELPSNLKVNPWSYVDNRSIDAVRDRALSKGPTPWGESMLGKQRVEQGKAAGDASAQANAGAALARSNLSMHGGLDSGARERVARGAATNLLNAGQDVRRQGEISRYDILTQDDKSKQNLMTQLPGMENARANTMMQGDQFNISNEIAEKRAADLAKINEYNEKMRAWGSNNLANATENAGKK